MSVHPLVLELQNWAVSTLRLPKIKEATEEQCHANHTLDVAAATVRVIASNILYYAFRPAEAPCPIADDRLVCHFVNGARLSPDIMETVVKNLCHDVNCILYRHKRLDLFLDDRELFEQVDLLRVDKQHGVTIAAAN